MTLTLFPMVLGCVFILQYILNYKSVLYWYNR